MRASYRVVLSTLLCISVATAAPGVAALTVLGGGALAAIRASNSNG